MRPTWKVVGVEPIFTVADIDDSVSHYERLGFTTSRRNTTYAFAHRDRLVIHLAQADRESPRAIGSIYLHVDDADVLADEWRRAGLNVVGPMIATTVSEKGHTEIRTAMFFASVHHFDQDV